MKNTLSVDLKGYDWKSDFIPDSGQEFKVGENVIVFHYFDNNGNEWNNARHMEPGDDEMLKKSHPSYSDMAGVTHYLVGKKTVTRIFKTKIWVK